MDDGSHYLLDVENGETAIECPPTFLRLLYSMAADVSIQHTDEQPPFLHTYETLLRGWRRERTTSLILIALNSTMPSALRTTAAHLANDLLTENDCLTATRIRLSFSPLSDEADFDGVPNSGTAFRTFLDFLRSRQPFIQQATNAWARARVRVAEYSSWATRLREITGRLGGFLAMSSALESGRPEEFDSWLSETLRTHPQETSSDLLRMMLAWKGEALALPCPEQHEIKLTESAPGATEGGAVVLPFPAAPLAHRIEKFLEALRSGALSSDEILSTFIDLAPSWLQGTAEDQGRSIADLVHDIMRSGTLNLAGISELALQQYRFQDLREVWVFARRPLDLEETFYSVVRHNVKERFVHYYYFVSDKEFFPALRERLIRDLGDPIHVDGYLHCVLVPDISFLTSPGIGLMIPSDIERMKGVHVTSIGEDGTIKEAQDLAPSELRRAYIILRTMIEERYPSRELPRLAGESAKVAKPI
jgi:hypothetical protein